MNTRLHRGRHGFTIVEILVVVAVIAALVAILVPALQSAYRSSKMTSAQSNLRQIFTFMQAYSNENRDKILPSQFDYSAANYKGKVRSELGPNALGQPHQGTWTDILWVQNGLFNLPDHPDYRFDSPDDALYESYPGYRENVLRSAMENSRDTRAPHGGLFPNTDPTPYGMGALASGLPGYFAANDFFNARPNAPAYTDPSGSTTPTPLSGRWYTMGQMKNPSRSMYVVDSHVGEVIVADPNDDYPAYNCRVNVASGALHATTHVDFRYNNNCLMLLLDGAIDIQSPWKDIDDLEQSRKVRVRWLDRR